MKDSETGSEPGNLYKDFLVDINPAKLAPTIESLDRQIDSLEDRISKIVHKFTVNNMPVMEPLLAFTQDPDELPPFAKGLTRAAALIKAKNTLAARKATLVNLSEAPHWYMGELKDFNNEIDDIVASLASSAEDPATDCE